MRGLRVVVVALSGALALGVVGPAEAKIKIHKIRYDPPGADYTNAFQLRAEYIVIKNTGGRRRQLRGFKVKDRVGHTYTFGRYRIPSKGYVKIHTGSGRDRRGDVFWGMGNFVWNNDGDTATLRTRGGSTVDRCSYAGGASSKLC